MTLTPVPNRKDNPILIKRSGGACPRRLINSVRRKAASCETKMPIHHLFNAAVTLVFILAGTIPAETADQDGPLVINIFGGHSIHFNPDNPNEFATGRVGSEDNGREIVTTLDLPAYERPVRITAYLAIYPVPKDERTVHDKWDRAGNIRLVREGKPDIELVKFVTAYGGFTEYDVDISEFAPLLQRLCTFKGFIDTWVSPAWQVDFRLIFETDSTVSNPIWTESVNYEQSFSTKTVSESGVDVKVWIPDSLDRVLLHYLVSGHCTDGRGADEFVQKDNVISVDGQVVYRYRPWRDDCRDFRDLNPYCAKWSDGYWSSDFSRSGWCPGDIVLPLELDLTDHLTPGDHTLRFNIENMRPVDDEGHHGYWRVSAYVTGWTLHE